MIENWLYYMLLKIQKNKNIRIDIVELRKLLNTPGVSYFLMNIFFFNELKNI